MVTLSEIAREAGVSKSTVSKALLGGGGKTTKVSDRTVRLVRETADKLGYRPNLVAQQLAHRKNDIIGVIIDSQCCGLYNNIMAAIEKRIFLSGRRLQIGLVHDSFDTIRRYVDDLLGYNIESVICLAHYYDFAATIPPLFKPFRNVLFINPPLSREPFSFVSPDYYGNFRLAVDALLRRGHRRIVYAKTAYDTPDCHARLRAYRDAHASAGLPVDEELIYCKPLREIDTPELVETFLDDVLPLRPDALLLGNPTTSGVCLKQLRKRGLAVPGDLSLTLPKRQLDDIIEMIYQLDKIAPGTANYDTLLYGAEVKFYSARLQLTGELETGLPNFFAAGDGAGVTRGLAQAGASGVQAARAIIKRM